MSLKTPLSLLPYALLLALTGCPTTTPADDDDSSMGDDDDDDATGDDDDDATGDDDDDSSAAMTIVDVAVEDGRFTILVDALIETGLDDALAADGAMTVFAPTDDAFGALPDGVLESLSAEELTDILLYHVVGAEVDSTAVAGLVTATTLLGAPVSINATSGVMINDATVIVPDVGASNGIIHAIDSVLLPPPSIAEVAAGAGTFTTLLAALSDAGLAETFADGTAGPFTVFAPTDDAFAAIADTVASLTPEQLSTVLQYHVVEGIVDSQAVVGLDSAPTLSGQSIAVDASAGVVLDSNSNVVATDIIARNGLVHVIDAVLVPAEL